MAEYSSTPTTSQPLIVQWVNKLANVYSSREFTRFYDKRHKALPWIPHTMVTQVQIILSSLAKISKSYLHHNVLKQQRNLHASILRTVLKTFHDVMDDIKRSIRGSGLGCFATPPPSYIMPETPPMSKQKLTPHFQLPPSSTQHSSNQTSFIKPERRRGWLIATGPYRWPQSLQCRQICNKFAQIDSACSLHHNCPHNHSVYPYGFNDHDRKVIYDFVTNNKNLSFPPHVKFVPHNNSSSTIPVNNSKQVSILKTPADTQIQTDSRE